MNTLFRWLVFLWMVAWWSPVAAASTDERPTDRTHFVSSSAFMLFNLLPFEHPPQFAQLNVGRRMTPKDTLIVQAITWQYHGPLGAPPTGPDDLFPGSARDIGVGLAYQRYFWRGLFGMVDATPFVQIYSDEAGDRIQTGFQLFVTGRVGYRFDIFDDRWFIEPSIAATAWPIRTNMPADFQAVEDQYPGFVPAEPGLNVGFAF